MFVRGYPSTGGGTISLTQGQVSGFTEINGFQYLKTDADIDAGNSGGIMFDDEGNFLGVPSYIVSNYENSGRVLHTVEITEWLDSTSGEEGVVNTQATSKLREEWKRFYQAREEGELIYRTDPKLSIKVPDGWDFLNISDSGFFLYKKNNGSAIIDLTMVSNGFKLNMTPQEKLDIFEKISEEDYDDYQFMEVGGYDALHFWSEGSDGSAHAILLSPGYTEIAITYVVPRHDEAAVLKEINTFC